jgi:hypothetical protein
MISWLRLKQGSQTHGPPDAFEWPANNSKTNKNVNFDHFKLIFRAFLVNCGPLKLFSNKLRPAEQFFGGMRPSNTFEFETPGLNAHLCLLFWFVFSNYYYFLVSTTKMQYKWKSLNCKKMFEMFENGRWHTKTSCDFRQKPIRNN